MILSLNAVENMYFRGNVKDTDIVLRISAKTYSRRAYIYIALRKTGRVGEVALKMNEPSSSLLGL